MSQQKETSHFHCDDFLLAPHLSVLAVNCTTNTCTFSATFACDVGSENAKRLAVGKLCVLLWLPKLFIQTNTVMNLKPAKMLSWAQSGREVEKSQHWSLGKILWNFCSLHFPPEATFIILQCDPFMHSFNAEMLSVINDASFASVDV